MGKSFFACVVLGLLLAPGVGISDAEKAKAVVAKAIQAHGGKSELTRLGMMRIKSVGIMYPGLGQPNELVTTDNIWSAPNQYKETMRFVKGKDFYIDVFDGKKGWKKKGGEKAELYPQEWIKEIMETVYVENLFRLNFIGHNQGDLSLLKPINISGKKAIGVLVKHKKYRPVKLFFDTTSGLLLKCEYEAFEFKGEVYFSDYKNWNGLKHYTKWTTFTDGEKTFDGRVTEIDFLKEIDRATFAEPK